jgi:hypothetical protein
MPILTDGKSGVCAHEKVPAPLVILELSLMQRKEWFELHDHKLFPGFLRDLVTDALEAIWNRIHVYRVIAPRLHAAMEKTGTCRIVDLCSGGGGPWLRLRQEIARMSQASVSVSFSDKYPNAQARARAHLAEGMDFFPAPVDATRIPAELVGFRTIFSSFHHFGPAEARAILADAAAQRQGIAVFEAAKRDGLTMLATIALPLVCWYVTPCIRPFRWSRILWTYLLPVVPLTLLMDGVLSCLRTYSIDDLRELAEGLGDEDYCWEAGEERGPRMGITYLIGRPGACAEVTPRPAIAELSSV